jgi:hypothetical protein
LLVQLGQALSVEFGRGFDATNLRHMRRSASRIELDALSPAAAGGQPRRPPVVRE